MRKLYLIITFLASLAFVSCTHNDGDIGPWFGDWRIVSYTVDGQDMTSENVSETIISFQSQVITVVMPTDSYGSVYYRVGTWTQPSASEVVFDFTHHGSADQDQSIYEAPQWLGWISSERMDFRLSDQKSRSMTLTWVSPSGAKHVYKIKKTW